MSICTVSDVYDAARSKLGDESAGLYTDTVLLPSVKSAYREFVRLLRNIGSPQIRSLLYYDLAPNVSTIDFVREPLIGIPGINFIERIDFRTFAATERSQVAGITLPTSTTVNLNTQSTHPLQAGAQIMFSCSKELCGVNFVNGLFTVSSVPDNLHLVFGLVGFPPVGGYIVNSAFVSWPSTDFTPMAEADILSPIRPLFDSQRYYSLLNNQLTVQPSTTWRQLRMKVFRSGDTLVSGSDEILFDDALDFLAARTAALAASGKGAPNKYAILQAEAYGENGDISEPTGGLAKQILNTAIKQLNTRQNKRPRYRQIKSPGGSATILWTT